VNSWKIEKDFPNLNNSGYKITSPATIDYNCIAWAAGDTERFWWPDPLNIGYWPPEAPRSVTLDAFVNAFETLGYVVCDSTKYENGFEKIALYVDSSGEPTHAARQIDFDHWTSKLGSIEDIEHSFDGVTGSLYGSVAVIMKRPKN
jgi:hypothetical protein